MEPSTWTSRVAISLLLVVSVAGATLAMRFHVKGHKVAAATVFTKQPISGTENQNLTAFLPGSGAISYLRPRR